ncbi:MAG: GNAT family N-acetyltransferase [Smithellaceae bacterium]|nr:GNAT family N-acetyltransferase [Smithellaceae bacterium]
MDVKIKRGCVGVDWGQVAAILKEVGMAHHEPELHEKAFRSSHTTVFAYVQDRLVGFGRAISDGAYQAAVYDMAVVPEFQGKGIGRAIMETILRSVAGCNVILYAAPGREGFYQRLGLRRMKTGMAIFVNAEAMAQRGFTE